MTLYAHAAVPTLALTVSWKGQRYNQWRVLSPMFEEIAFSVMRECTCPRDSQPTLAEMGDGSKRSAVEQSGG